MIDAFAAADVGIVVAVGAVVAFAVIFAFAQGPRGDQLERLADWARVHGLEYVPPVRDSELATFVGELGGLRVRVCVARVAVRLGRDVPTRLTTITVGEPVGATICVLQPAEWVMDRDGSGAGERVPTGDAAFDAAWAARPARVEGADAGGKGDGGVGEVEVGVGVGDVERALSPRLRARLLQADAAGLILEVSSGAVAVVMPGICADAVELDRRVAVASALAKVLQ